MSGLSHYSWMVLGLSFDLKSLFFKLFGRKSVDRISGFIKIKKKCKCFSDLWIVIKKVHCAILRQSFSYLCMFVVQICDQFYLVWGLPPYCRNSQKYFLSSFLQINRERKHFIFCHAYRFRNWSFWKLYKCSRPKLSPSTVRLLNTITGSLNYAPKANKGHTIS